MKKETIIIALIGLLVLPSLSKAQRPGKASAEEKMQQAAKTAKGTSALTLNWDINKNEFFKDKTSSGICLCNQIGYEYWFVNRWSISAKIGQSIFINWIPDGNATQSLDFNAQLGIRGYFFKRAGFFAEVGTRMGSYKYAKNDTTDPSNKKEFYILPMVSLGYEYLITNLHPYVDNHLGLEIYALCLIPVKKDQMSWYIPVLPGVEIGFSLKYHFSPKAKVQNIILH